MSKTSDSIKSAAAIQSQTMSNNNMVHPVTAVEDLVAGKPFTGFVKMQSSLRFVHNPTGRAYDETKDLSLNDFKESEAGLTAILDVLVGKISGRPDIFFTAPEKKAFFANPTGKAGYVRGDYDGSYVITHEGNSKLLEVPEDLLPAEPKEWARLRFELDRVIVSRSRREVYGPYKGYWTYKYCTAVSAVLAGSIVSVKCGPSMLEKANQIMDVLGLETQAEKETAARDFRNGQLAARNGQRKMWKTSRAQEVIDSVTGTSKVYGDADFKVSTIDSKEIDLRTLAGKTIKIATLSGLRLPTVSVSVTEKGIANQALTMNSSGWVFVKVL
jgi:hypothetical protein